MKSRLSLEQVENMFVSVLSLFGVRNFVNKVNIHIKINAPLPSSANLIQVTFQCSCPFSFYVSIYKEDKQKRCRDDMKGGIMLNREMHTKT